jgi:hypothetical protein
MSDNKKNRAKDWGTVEDQMRENKMWMAFEKTYGAGINPEAVPELLAALKSIFKYADNYLDSGPIGQGWQSNKQQVDLEKAKAAIEKATIK